MGKAAIKPSDISWERGRFGIIFPDAIQDGDHVGVRMSKTRETPSFEFGLGMFIISYLFTVFTGSRAMSSWKTRLLSSPWPAHGVGVSKSQFEDYCGFRINLHIVLPKGQRGFELCSALSHGNPVPFSISLGIYPMSDRWRKLSPTWDCKYLGENFRAIPQNPRVVWGGRAIEDHPIT
ncbi:hypothetical protein DUI87_09667 [Hirundo rustica rustica]|uniref:Uncharacterized protein n=1 Tax=Hirundo rustica rustica TaxID=333673 RepID=A0A3M0KUW6_HIRRU|nr:hypothetical protein DUI87_09667 [Hirundo rustica rustica]